MFREGYYLEIIKAKHSAATAVITVKEKTVDVKKKKMKTNKWLTLEDWASVYEVLEKALLQNVDKKPRSTEKKKFTRRLEIAYTFEASENPVDRTSLPTVRVSVSYARREKKKKTSTTGFNNNNNNNDDNNDDNKNIKKRNKEQRENRKSDETTSTDSKSVYKVEEYIPDTPNTSKTNKKKVNDDDDVDGITKIGYVPSRKSTLELLQQRSTNNEYVPSVFRDETTIANDLASSSMDDLYVPNSVTKTEYDVNETYEPSSLTNFTETSCEYYIPNSKGWKKNRVDEYQPDFIARNKTMKFDDSYVPSSTQMIKELKKKNDRKLSKNRDNRKKNKNVKDNGDKTVVDCSNSVKRGNGNGQGEIKREM